MISLPLNTKRLVAEFDELTKNANFTSRPISRALKMPGYERKGDGPVVMLSSGMHGDEPAGILAAREFLRNGALGNFHWLITPMLNPTGLAIGTRENENGIDLNRDYGGSQSQEARAHENWLATAPKPDLFISLHEDYDATGFYFYELGQPGRESISGPVLSGVRHHLPLEPGPIIDGREANGPGHFYRTEAPEEEEFRDGYPEAIYIYQKGYPLSLTFETPTQAAPLEKRVQAHMAAIKAALANFQEI